MGSINPNKLRVIGNVGIYKIESPGTIYLSAREAAVAWGYPHSTMCSYLNGGTKNPTTLKYI